MQKMQRIVLTLALIHQRILQQTIQKIQHQIHQRISLKINRQQIADNLELQVVAFLKGRSLFCIHNEYHLSDKIIIYKKQ